MSKFLTLFFFFFFLSSCEDPFLRFKYENFNCKKNKFNIQKIKIVKKQIGSEAKVIIGEKNLIFKITQKNKKEIILTNNSLSIELKILEKNKKINGSFRNNIFKLHCQKEAFRI